jgi:hypothetical protein
MTQFENFIFKKIFLQKNNFPKKEFKISKRMKNSQKITVFMLKAFWEDLQEHIR